MLFWALLISLSHRHPGLTGAPLGSQLPESLRATASAHCALGYPHNVSLPSSWEPTRAISKLCWARSTLFSESRSGASGLRFRSHTTGRAPHLGEHPRSPQFVQTSLDVSPNPSRPEAPWGSVTDPYRAQYHPHVPPPILPQAKTRHKSVPDTRIPLN